MTIRISAPIKLVSVAMCFIELCERASYYGVYYVFSNYVRGKLPAGGNGAGAVAPGDAGTDQSAGALGMGSVAASAVTSTFKFLAYLLPIFGGIIADTKLGRFKTIFIGTLVGVLAHFLLVIPAIPSVIASGHAFPPFMIFVVSLRTLLEQVGRDKMFTPRSSSLSLPVSSSLAWVPCFVTKVQSSDRSFA